MQRGGVVWGGISCESLQQLFLLQKKCIRILFGNKEAYIDKFKTSARTRVFHDQKLTNTNFYVREHTKPLFKANTILTLHSLYCYHSLIMLYKTLRFKSPYSLYICFNVSVRKETLIIVPLFSHNFVYKAAVLWNNIRTTLVIKDFSQSISVTKVNIKAHLQKIQNLGDQIEWSPENIFSK